MIRRRKIVSDDSFLWKWDSMGWVGAEWDGMGWGSVGWGRQQMGNDSTYEAPNIQSRHLIAQSGASGRR